jgi:hypothetical protein
LNPKPHEGQLENQKVKKAQECHLKEEKIVRLTRARKTTNQAK